MKPVVLCGGDSPCCPSVAFEDEKVLIGEEGNLVKLTMEQWNILVEKVRTGELNTL